MAGVATGRWPLGGANPEGPHLRLDLAADESAFKPGPAGPRRSDLRLLS
jgi:hypothetical protein